MALRLEFGPRDWDLRGGTKKKEEEEEEEKKKKKEKKEKKENRSPKGNIWSAIPLALL